MTYQERKEISELAAKLSFEQRFMHKMKNKDIEAFKKDYRTLYNEVIIPLIAEERFLAESFKEANTRLDRDLKEIIGERVTGSVQIAVNNLKLERDAFSNEVMKQRETIKQMQKALRDAREFIISQSATKAAFEALDTVNQALSKSRNQ